jgi:hypothetical protein
MYEVTAYRKGNPQAGTGSKYHMLIRRLDSEHEAHRFAQDLVESKGYQYASIERMQK